MFWPILKILSFTVHKSSAFLQSSTCEKFSRNCTSVRSISRKKVPDKWFVLDVQKCKIILECKHTPDTALERFGSILFSAVKVQSWKSRTTELIHLPWMSNYSPQLFSKFELKWVGSTGFNVSCVAHSFTWCYSSLFWKHQSTQKAS